MMGRNQAFSEFSAAAGRVEGVKKKTITRKCKRQRAVKPTNYRAREQAAETSSTETLTEQSGARCAKQNPSRCLDR